MDKPLVLIVLLALCLPARAQMLSYIVNMQGVTGIGLIANTSCNNTSSGGNCTTSAVNTTGANICIWTVSDFGSNGTAGSVADLAGNIWYGPYLQCDTTCGGGTENNRVYYAPNLITNASETFTWTGTTFASSAIACFSGVAHSAPIGQFTQAGAATSVSTLAAGSMTPVSANNLIVTSWANGSATAGPTVSSPYTITNSHFNVSNTTAYGLAYDVQTTAAAINGTWSWTTGGVAAVNQVGFLPASVGNTFDLFFNFETSTSGTAITQPIAVASAVSAGQLNGASGNFTVPATTPGTQEILSACQSPPQITGKNIAGTSNTDSSGTRGLANITAAANLSAQMKYVMPLALPANPNVMLIAAWDLPFIAAGETGTFYSMFGPNNGGDFSSLMHHNGTLYVETHLNLNGNDDFANPATSLGGTIPNGAFQWTTGSSTTSNTVGTGALTFTTATSLGLAAGTWVEIATSNNLGTASGAMLAQVTSDTGTTLVVNSHKAYGSGTATSWVIIPWYYINEQFVGYKVATTGTSVCTPALVACTVTTAASLGLAANTVVSFFDGTTNGVSGIVTSDTGTALVINVINAYGTGTLTSGNVSTSAHTQEIYDSLGNLVSTQLKASNPAQAGSPTNFAFGFGGDNGDAGNTICIDGAAVQWSGAAEYPVTP